VTLGSPWFLIALSFLSLIGFGFSGLLVSQAHARSRMQAKRIEGVVAPFRRARAAQIPVFRASPTTEKSLLELAASLFGFSPSNADQYPCKWWLVLGVACVCARVAAGFLVDFFGVLGFAAMPVLWVVLCRTFFGWAVGRRQTALLEQFPDAIAMIVRSVRVGIPVLGAINSVARETQEPTSTEFAKLGNEVAVGVPLDQAVVNMGSRTELAEYRFFATAIGLQAQTGGGLSETLENLADLIRKRIALRQRGHALSSEARTSSLMLGALPVVMGGGLWLLNPAYMALLFNTSMGHKILGVAAGSLCCGAFAMRTIIRKSLS
jgi:tight adherence protein B